MEHLECSSKELSIGLEVFFTRTKGIGGKLKRSPEDFLVEEISAFPEKVEGGKFTVAKVTAENWEMNRLVRQLSRSLGISRSKIGFAGTKDKRAVTTQLMSFEVPLEQVTSLSLHQVTITDAYRAKKGIDLGELIGNAFNIRVSSCLLDGIELKNGIDDTKRSLIDLRWLSQLLWCPAFRSAQARYSHRR